MPDFYTRSNGESVDITEMHFPHLEKATLKLERTDPENPELPAMRKLVDQKREEYEREQAERGDAHS